MIVELKRRIEKDFDLKLDLNPEDFIKCNTLSQLNYEITHKFEKNDDRIIYEQLNIPREFIDEWKKLVGFIPNNVMTYERKNRIINDKDVYVEIYSGNYLNHKKHTWSWNTFDLGEYSNFNFDKAKNYRCYLYDTDHWESITTSLLFAEEV